jgi:hypothetical protein
MPVTLGDPIAVVFALGADDLIDLERHQLVHNAEPDADAERQQSLPRCPHQLRERLLDLRRQRTLRPLQRAHDRRRGYLAHGGSSCPRGLGWRLSRSQRERTRREDRRSKFYEIPDNLRQAGVIVNVNPIPKAVSGEPLGNSKAAAVADALGLEHC